jgi:hypothetical protein
VTPPEGNENSGRGGCLLIVLLLIAVGAVVMVLISLAALFDPFSWMPTVDRVWEDCRGDCALAHRFPGFWWHATANLIYGAITLVASVMFGLSVADLRETRVKRYNSTAADGAFQAARRTFMAAGSTLAALALLPIVVAVA